MTMSFLFERFIGIAYRKPAASRLTRDACNLQNNETARKMVAMQAAAK
jgi:hypothetical protein